MTKEQSFSADSASVQERQVTVRVLTIGTKQVTQSLYRQLIDESVLDSKANLKGKVWGWVNFHNGCECVPTHLHPIWDDGNMLKRCVLTKSPKDTLGYNNIYKQLRRVGLAFLCATVLEKGLSGNGYVDTINIWAGSRSMPLDMPKSVKELQWFYFNNWTNNIEIKQEAVNDDLDTHLRVSNLPITLRSSSELGEELTKIDAKLIQYELAYSEIYNEIEDAGQLFIAVSGVWK